MAAVLSFIYLLNQLRILYSVFIAGCFTACVCLTLKKNFVYRALSVIMHISTIFFLLHATAVSFFANQCCVNYDCIDIVYMALEIFATRAH